MKNLFNAVGVEASRVAKSGKGSVAASLLKGFKTVERSTGTDATVVISELEVGKARRGAHVMRKIKKSPLL